MSWLISIVVALITAGLCGAGALWLSVHAVQWYRVTSREGASGYAAIGLALLGAIGSLIIGFIAARIGVAQGWGGFGGQLLWSLGVCAGLLALTGLGARLFADVPPRLGGEELDLDIELRFPAEATSKPADEAGQSRIELGAMARFKRVVRMRRSGDLFFDQARIEDGRWVLPGRVPVFTTRGKRVLLVTINGKSEGFLVPLPGRPTQRETQWSDWLPKAPQKPGPYQNVLGYRFRVKPG